MRAKKTISPPPAGPDHPFGFSGQPGEERIGDMGPDELLAWENEGLPGPVRTTDKAEAFADEQLDEVRSLNFPLHWRTWLQSWGYLFDLSVACALLEPRPDDAVLDLAAGTCWASEFLHRLGVRTVALDVSAEMMRRGRARLAADRRIEFRDEAAFVAGRAQELPFARSSFDGLVCFNALHHLPSYAQALGEIHRVLKPGGRAVFSEPGAFHAREAVSQSRMREDGVLEKNVPLLLIRRLAEEAGFARMRVIPLRDAAEYAFDFAAGPADRPALERMWRDTLVLGPAEHARFMLEKAPGRAPDSCLPPAQLVRHLRARITIVGAPDRVRKGDVVVIGLRVANEGAVIWRAKGRRFGGQVTCGLKLCTEADAVIRDDLGRTPLPSDVGPGEEIRLDIRFRADLNPGRYLLRFDMVVEGVTWFEPHGSPAPRRPLEVTA